MLRRGLVAVLKTVSDLCALLAYGLEEPRLKGERGHVARADQTTTRVAVEHPESVGHVELSSEAKRMVKEGLEDPWWKKEQEEDIGPLPGSAAYRQRAR